MKGSKSSEPKSVRTLATVITETSVTKIRVRVVVDEFAPPHPNGPRGRTRASAAEPEQMRWGGDAHTQNGGALRTNWPLRLQAIFALSVIKAAVRWIGSRCGVSN